MTAPPAAAPFDVCGPLPGPGITVLEASAGTGKTFTLTTIVARFVADGVDLRHILAVTFTRMATGELRERIRRRLVTAEDGLRRHLESGEPLPLGDDLVALLAHGDRGLVGDRRRRLADAVASFDAATIATTHGLCHLVLEGLGAAGDVATGVTLLEDPADLVDEVVADLYLRRALRHGPPPFTLATARAAATKAVANPDILLTPTEGDDAAGLLGRLAGKARREVGRRLQEDNLVTYDQLLFRLATTLADPGRGPLACRRLRQRYRVVLVDEFQDTDPVQWEVIRSAFGDGATTLILVGDPKQAIYSFRGADVQAYIDAAEHASTWTLARNWRADQPLLDATDALLNPLHLGHESIRFRSVDAPGDRRDSGIRNVGPAAPVRVRLVAAGQPGIQITPSKGLLQKSSLVEWIAGDVTGDIARLLACGAEIRSGSPEPGTGGWRALDPADIAVLTRTVRQSIAVRDALRAAGVPAVAGGLDSVFASEAALDWLRLLEALQEPASRPRAVAVAMSPFVGMTATEVATAGERRWESVHGRIHRWSAVLARHGVAGLYRSMTATEGLPARVLAYAGGERRLTDLGHVAHLLHAESARTQLGAPALRAWLAQRVQEAGNEQADAEERSRRIDSDAEAVQVLTVHRAKGLEFGVVYCPFLWDAPQSSSDGEPVVFHDLDNDGHRTLDVGCPAPDGPARRRYQDHRRAASAEQQDEELRLMYVALTRARHQVVLWWGRASGSRSSPLGRLLMCRNLLTGAVGQPRPGEPKDADVRAALGVLAARGEPGMVAVEEAGAATGEGRLAGGVPASPPDPDALRPAAFERILDLRWRRSSYTSITAAAHAGQPGADPVGSEPEDPGLGDEPRLPAGPPIVGQDDRHPTQLRGGLGVACPLGGLAGGTEMGTFVHRVLETIDFAAADLHSEVTAALRRHPIPAEEVGGDPGLLADGLVAALLTPLGPMLPGVTLAAIARRDRLDELAFELPLAGGDQPMGEVTTATVAALLADHLDPDGPLGGYPDRLGDPLLASGLRGYLTGSLDLVFRRTAATGQRWYVADYKTNWLGEHDRDLTAWHYRPDALDAEMQRRHYPLQALLYLVALHRYLGWRLPGYDPAAHLGGVVYLFIRGMVGPAAPAVDGQPCGVFSWAPPAALITGLSELLDTGDPGR